MTIFDQHPEVLTCHWVHYIYSYIITEFGETQILKSNKAYQFIIDRSYFRYVFSNLNDKIKQELIRFGGDPSSKLDRDKAIDVFKEIVLSKKEISRRNLIIAAYYAYSIGLGKNINKIKYILVSDSATLKNENKLKRTSGKIVHEIVRDFPDAKGISLVRDPRADFASSRHQFVNSQGNMYGIRFGNYITELIKLYKINLSMNQGCVYLYWLIFIKSGARIMWALKHKYKKQFITIRNEDLNISFIPTIEYICRWLGISFWNGWKAQPYIPTSVGIPWKGTGAYNNRYQTYKYGPLQNDPQKIADKVTGPNVYVTQRWKTRMSKSEIKVLEILFYKEMNDLSYELMFQKGLKSNHIRLICNLIFPFKGEIPGLRWIINGKYVSFGEIFQRLFYILTFPPFYVISRIVLLRLYCKGFFYNNAIR